VTNTAIDLLHEKTNIFKKNWVAAYALVEKTFRHKTFNNWLSNI